MAQILMNYELYWILQLIYDTGPFDICANGFAPSTSVGKPYPRPGWLHVLAPKGRIFGKYPKYTSIAWGWPGYGRATMWQLHILEYGDIPTIESETFWGALGLCKKGQSAPCLGFWEQDSCE